MNQKLIKQVQEGTHCTEFTGLLTPQKLERLQSLMKRIAPLDNMEPNGERGFYMFDTMDEFWYREVTPPTGLTPIPLDDFFKDEEHPGSNKYCACGDPSCEYYKPTPEQPLPEELVSKHLESTWDNILRSKSDYGESSSKITIDYMGRFLEWCEERRVIDKYYPKYSTFQLIELFFNQQSK